MAVHFLKQAEKREETRDEDARPVVLDMLAKIKTGGEAAIRQYARDLDGWDGDIVVAKDTILDAERRLAETVKDDIRFAHARVRDFAVMQRDSQSAFERTLVAGLTVGQRLVPVTTAGCYVPGGLNEQKFIKVLTYQRMTREATREVAQVAARISRLEGMEGHAMTGDVRLAKYFPDEVFRLDVEGVEP